jgi:hypothetical protein
MAHLFCLTLTAQSRWTIGGHWGANSSNIVDAGFPNEWSQERNARAPQYGFLVKYHLNSYWAIRVERNQEVRGRNYPNVAYDTLGNESFDDALHRSYFLTLPIFIEGSVGKKYVFQAAIGIIPMYQQNASITVASRPIIPFFDNPRSMNGHTQFGWIGKVGYSQKLYQQLHFYIEGSFNLNWSVFEDDFFGKGHYYAYSGGVGLTYRLPKATHLLCKKWKG